MLPSAVPDPGQGRAAGLTDLERAVLDLESLTWRHAGAKEHEIRERLGVSPTAYYQMLNGLLDREAALACRPLLVQRLRRTRGTRRRAGRPVPPAAPAAPTVAQET